ncbi:DNA polymerase III subunit delta [Spiribacter vilamensis]|uniref:DNA polymerase III subunit delta n=1 Tax=Spiribacter vilamensis TaxID=531306 RepID=A0A4Q8CXZ8_9GAMM|nr:DNA polymerase III subunit delta [Spiribacter vilamensis]RZU97821.1 DNA polymerase III delta subunit [Spiribacter vilamensis]TVO61255.1 DNA polymerase III subunit delta [Spiribacter vilamensis]
MPEVRFDELPGRIDRDLAPIYLIAGEEPLLIEEALDRLRRRARQSGFDEREVLHVDQGFDWQRLAAATDNLSLFTERRLIELRLPGGKPGRDGSAALKARANAPDPGHILIVVTGRLETAQRQSAWAKAIASAGVMAYAWPLRRSELGGWARRRAREHGMQLDAETAAVMAERNEGNLLALAQEIEKLALLADGGPISEEMARDAVSDSARFAVFDLPEAMLAGDPVRTLRILRRLRTEGEEPVLVLWGVARDIRVLADLQASMAGGERAAAVMGRHRIWKNRQGRLQTVARATPAGVWARLLGRAARVDRVIKGAEPGRPWDELLELSTVAARRVATADRKERHG